MPHSNGQALLKNRQVKTQDCSRFKGSHYYYNCITMKHNQWVATIKGESFHFHSDMTRARFKAWLRENQGKQLSLKLEDAKTPKLIRFYWGAVVPYMAIQLWNFVDWEHSLPSEIQNEVSEALKAQFNCTYIQSPFGAEPVRIGKSIASMNKDEMGRFLESINDYCMQNGYTFPDSVVYKSWENSAPLAGAEYPEVVNLRLEVRERLISTRS
jgi:hypothetical protein